MTGRLGAAIVFAAALAGCEQTMETAATGAGSGLPSPAQSTCMAAVAEAADDMTVTVLSEAPSGNGSEVIVGVGEDRAPWRCVTRADGTVAQVMSIADQGVL